MSKTKIFLIAAALTAGCTDLLPVGPRRALTPRRATTPTSGAAAHYLSANDEFEAIASAESTFAGFYHDGATPIILLTDTTRLSAALAGGLDGSLRGRRLSTSRIVVRRATYSFRALKMWYDREEAAGMAGKVESSIDVPGNRLHFRVTTFAAREQALTALAKLAIPGQAVIVDVGPPPVLASGTLRDYFRPLVGGIQTKIAFDTGASQIRVDTVCTLGFVVQHVGANFFTSASHCSDTMYLFESIPDSTWQDSVKSSQYIGVKYEDPPALTGSSSPTGYSPCRYSDAALFQIPSGVSVSAGLIALAKSPNSGNDTLSSSSPLTITDSGGWSGGSYYAPVAGDTIWKTGRTTGTTSGTVIDPCKKVSITRGSGYTVTVLCEVEVHADAYFGDSGSPVYEWDGSSSTTTLWGILNAIRPNGSRDTMFFSPLENINQDFVNAGYGRVGWFVPPPAAISGATVSGPTTVGQYIQCSWSGSASGGAAPWFFDWEAPYVSQIDTVSSESDSFGYDNAEFGGFDITLNVTDNYGDSSSYTLGVNGTGYGCGY